MSDEPENSVSLLRRSLGLVDVAVDAEVYMLYATYLGQAGARAYFRDAPCIALGVTVTRLQWIESARGSAAAWVMLALGLAYLAWGAKRALRRREHNHWHTHADGTVHCHRHGHHREHLHAHPHRLESLSPWLLFVVFLLGPCEPLIPLLMVPAARSSLIELVAVVTVFGVVTLATMVAVVLIGVLGSSAIQVPALERWGHALAASVIVLAASGVLFLGL